MNSDKPYIHKRVIAYFLDILIISIVGSVLAYFIPRNNDYEVKSKEFSSIVESLKKKEITQEEYLQKSNNLSYDISKSTVDITLITCALSLLYFVLFNYLRDGETIGKKIMKIKIVSANGKKLHINNYLLRCLIVNSILVNTVTSAMLIFLSKKNYLTYYSKVNNVFTIFFLGCLILALFRNDGRGLHDLISNTVVINTKKPIKEEVTTKDAVYEEMPNVIQIDNDIKEEKKVDNKKKKKSKKQMENPEGVSEGARV